MDNFDVSTFRFVNESDIVPHVPTRGFFNRYRHIGTTHFMRSDGTITSSEAAWRRALRQVAQILFFGAASLPADAISDHSIDEYIGKLEGHSLNG